MNIKRGLFSQRMILARTCTRKENRCRKMKKNTHGPYVRTAQKCSQPSLRCSTVRFVHATVVRETPRSRRLRHRFGPVQASPALRPCEPPSPARREASGDLRRSFRHYDTLPSWSSSERRSPQILSVRKYNTLWDVQLKRKRRLYLKDILGYSASKKKSYVRCQSAHGVPLLFCGETRACHQYVRRRARDHLATDSVRSKPSFS